MRPLAPLLVLLMVLVAGCAGRDDGLAPLEAPDPTTTSVPIAIQTAGPGPLGSAQSPFDVPSNATRVLIEARWSCASPTCRLTMTVVNATGDEVASEPGVGQADLAVEAPIAGTYTLAFAADAPVADVSGEARVTVFYRDAPDGFTAWDEAPGASRASVA